MLPCAPNAASSGNPANLVVAVGVVLGLGTAEIPATQNLAIRGPRGCMPASVSSPLLDIFAQHIAAVVSISACLNCQIRINARNPGHSESQYHMPQVRGH